MKKKVWIVDHFSQALDDNGNNRFVYLAKLLVKAGYDTEIITSDFSHTKKQTRHLKEKDLASLPYKYTMLHEPPYRNNISIRRIMSHRAFGKRLRLTLRERTKPDLIFIATPSLDAAYEAVLYCKKNMVPSIVDIQDLWPEAFRLVFSIPLVSDLIYAPMHKKADFIYRHADRIVAVSETYLKRGLQVRSDNMTGLCVFLGTDLLKFDEAYNNSTVYKPDNEKWIIYAGTHGKSYSLKLIIDAVSMLDRREDCKIVFKVLGDGPLSDEYKKYAKKKAICADFLGRLPYTEMVAYLAKADIAVNPIAKGALQSIINKHGDYAAAGVPVVSTQDNAEYCALIEKYECGVNCAPDDAQAVTHALQRLIDNPDERRRMGKNGRRLAENYFDRRVTYNKLVDLINAMTERDF